ncbi:hypothetical protein ES332_A12G279400v1 [Gossypium tomentosum]|uniref:Uncharacterized protein n=1 Tax=Gossypium tomentosum TaxID=34277 RepID=A0A5D2N277_GOSTO|nr:hypothetical protein ES332_A12G279400v1 [Gossypium tomentosum]
MHGGTSDGEGEGVSTMADPSFPSSQLFIFCCFCHPQSGFFFPCLLLVYIRTSYYYNYYCLFIIIFNCYHLSELFHVNFEETHFVCLFFFSIKCLVIYVRVLNLIHGCGQNSILISMHLCPYYQFLNKLFFFFFFFFSIFFALFGKY